MRAAPLALFAFVAVGCGSDPVGGDPVEVPEPVTCEVGPGYRDETVTPIHVGAVSALVLDTDGAPVDEGLLVQVCGVNVGANLCVYGEVGANGEVTVPTDFEFPKPAFKVGDGLRFGKLGRLLDEASNGVDLGTVHLPRLPADGAPLRVGATAESGGARLGVAANARIEFDLLEYRTPEDQAFRAAALPVDLVPPEVDAGADLELLYTLAPLATTFCPAATLELPNDAGWEPGTPVEFLLQGLDIDQQPWAPYGEWAVVATGEVSADGEFVATTDRGIALLGSIGVRRR
jgi:hypothetical protein